MQVASNFSAKETRNPNRTLGFSKSFRKTLCPWSRPIGICLINASKATKAAPKIAMFIV